MFYEVDKIEGKLSNRSKSKKFKITLNFRNSKNPEHTNSKLEDF